MLNFFAGGNSLNNGLVSYWNTDQASGADRTDAISAITMTDNGGNVTQATGKVNFAGSFTRASNTFLTHNDTALLNPSTSFTWAFWMYPATFNVAQTMISKWSGTNNSAQYLFIMIDNSGHSPEFAISDGTNLKLIDSAVNMSANTWYLVVGWYDSVAQTVNIQVSPDGGSLGAVESAAATTGINATGGKPLRFGTDQAGANDSYNGRLDSIGFWNRVLTTAERADLFTNPRDYPF